MAKKKKDYSAAVRKVNKGQKSCKKIDAVHKMVESLIKNDSDTAAEHLHTYLQMTAREVLLGEKEDDKKDDDKDSDDKKDDKPEKGKKGVNPFAKKDDDKDSDDDDDDKKDDDKDSDDDDDKDDKKDDDKDEKDED